jgi:RNA polymerase sigma-70 factor (ECF subfamily)
MSKQDDRVPESQALEELAGGHIGGLETLVRLHQSRAIGVAFQITGDRQTAEDMVADAFVTVYERIGQFDPRRPFAPWFYRIVVNNALKAVRGRGKHTNGEEGLYQQPSAAISPEASAVQQEEASAMADAISGLPTKQRAAIVLMYYLDMSEVEIATTMGVPRGTVKWRLHAARHRLQLALKSSDHETLLVW